MTTLTIPKFEQQIIDKDTTNKQWYFFLQGLWKGTPPAPEAGVLVGASPFTYVAIQKGFMVISGGTISVISFSRDGSNFYSAGPQLGGAFPLSNGDSLRVTYTVKPTMTFFPQ